MFIAAIFISCTSSSYSSRYNKPEEKERTVHKKTRFSSDESVVENEDSSPEESDSEKSFSDVGDVISEFDEEPVEDVVVNVDEFVSSNRIPSNMEIILTGRDKMLMEIIRYLDSPYQYGGMSKNGIDCSGFTKKVFQNSIEESLPRTASEQFQLGQSISSTSSLKFGDLVFFNTSRRSYPGHVGIYIGENLFAHASLSKGVIISSFESDYYKKRFVSGKRLDLNLK